MRRTIRRSSGQSSTEVAALLQSIFASEFFQPSRCIWLVSPWISDIEILDNRSSDFDALGEWGPRPVRLSEVLSSLTEHGVRLVIATTNDPVNRSFLDNLSRRVGDLATDNLLTIHRDETDLHEKALTTDTGLVFGSMNFTYNGVFIRGELIEFTSDIESVNDARLDNYQRFGGLL